MPTVVAITSVSVQEIPNYFRAFGFGYGTQQYSSEGSGSGIIVGENDDELLIATNNHVVSGATTLSVCFVGNDFSKTELKTRLGSAIIKIYKGVVGTLCGDVNILEWFLVSPEMTRLICGSG